MAEGGFSVYVWTSDGKYRATMRFVDAETAVNEAARLAKSVTAQEGVYTRVMITDGGDLCCFDWRHGEGVVAGYIPVIEHARSQPKPMVN